MKQAIVTYRFDILTQTSILPFRWHGHTTLAVDVKVDWLRTHINTQTVLTIPDRMAPGAVYPVCCTMRVRAVVNDSCRGYSSIRRANKMHVLLI